MSTLELDPAVCEAFPDLAVAAVTADGVAGDAAWPEAERLLTAAETGAADGSLPPLQESDPLLASWQRVYRAFGTNPRRTRPSVHALSRRLASSGRLPRVNPAVDAYNAVSVTCQVPVGAFDLARVHGDVRLRHAAPGDAFVPLGAPDTVEHPTPGEVVYADQATAQPAVLTRHWNHRDSDRTKVTPASRRVLFLLEAVDAVDGRKALDQAVPRLTELLAEHTTGVTVRVLTAQAPSAGVG